MPSLIRCSSVRAEGYDPIYRILLSKAESDIKKAKAARSSPPWSARTCPGCALQAAEIRLRELFCEVVEER